MAPELLVAIAVAFAVVTGINDGGALLAPNLRVPGLSVPVSLIMLVIAVVTVPLLVSTGVASTMLDAIVPADVDGSTALATGFVAAVLVVAALARIGLPTSLTLAVIGGIAGAGVGLGLPVGWASVLRVLVIGIVAPVVGALLALGAARLWHTANNARYLSTVRRTHVTAFTAQCVAYGANDGQKALVLFFAASVAAGHGRSLDWWVYLVVAVAFAVGALIGLRTVGDTVGNGILSTRPTHAVTAEFAAAAAVLGSAAVGTPVSMTQSITGGLLGAGIHDSVRRVRWQAVRKLALAWAVTLPAAFGVAAGAGALLAATT